MAAEEEEECDEGGIARFGVGLKKKGGVNKRVVLGVVYVLLYFICFSYCSPKLFDAMANCAVVFFFFFARKNDKVLIIAALAVLLLFGCEFEKEVKRREG